jgi:Tol biopolymer transport system component
MARFNRHMSGRNVRRGDQRRIFVLILAFGVIAVAATPSWATFPGTNGRISFTAGVERTKGNEIFTANPNGSDVKRLTTSGRNHTSFISDWSPDGQTIAFDSDRVDVDGRRDVVQIYLMDADGTNVRQLTRGAGFHGAPGWSPDGASLAIETDWGDPALQGIWIIPASDPDGVTRDEARRVTTIPKGVDFDSEPQFSPDGSTIVFTRFKSLSRSAIHRVNVDGTGLVRLTPFRLNASDPDWSPDGQRIAFDSGDAGRPGSRGNIFVMRDDGSKRKRLTDHPRIRRGDAGEPMGERPPVAPLNLANNPVWSPSGTKIMYTRFLPNRTAIRKMNPDGSHNRVVLERSGFPNKVDWGTHP